MTRLDCHRTDLSMLNSSRRLTWPAGARAEKKKDQIMQLQAKDQTRSSLATLGHLLWTTTPMGKDSRTGG
eukprot:5248646-Karenia_brevis.AAC.1